ncbi:hypothetical protein HK100_009904 [Physocladia obscura]|uniref:Amidase domain-containing protein n=1 Tax=Physocladia obscura TaxID=109957 RepID=A0AAD5T2Z8_9FUNG|nr:hypothetical protein HK100_009904 [Physocladia obscura]
MVQIDEASIYELRSAMDSGSLTCSSLVSYYLDKIAVLNSTLRAVIEVNPDVLTLASTADTERSTLTVVPLMHGIPDNIATKDKMQTTAGSWILLNSIVPRDAFLVSKLRESGAIILGKTNLSEWCNWRIGPNSGLFQGWSGRGGQTINPFGGPVGGSSSGSAVAATVNMAAVTLGSETDGSIIYPASLNGVVGMKPTVGLVSRSGVIPVSHSQDCVGPIGRTVSDVAAVLDAIVGSDPRDIVTRNANNHLPLSSFVGCLLELKSLQNFRIGIDRRFVDQYCLNAASILGGLGATVISIEFPNVHANQPYEIELLNHEFKHSINLYLAELLNCQVGSLEDIIFETKGNPLENMYPTVRLEEAQATLGLNHPKYQNAAQHQKVMADSIKSLFYRHKLDAIIGISVELSTPAAIAGLPVITVPAPSPGIFLPQAVGFIAPQYGDAKLLQIAFVYERCTKGRKKLLKARQRLNLGGIL